MKVYGPYQRADGRRHVIHYDGVTRRTQSYPRYLMEQYLGRTLESWEYVDHINEDHTDDRIENYQLLSQQQNNKKSVIVTGRQEKFRTCTCPTCKCSFEVKERQFQSNQIKQGKAGPYCSRSCAGKAHH